MKILEFNKKDLFSELKNHLFKRYENTNDKVDESVKKILDDVKNQGDQALIKYTKEFDKIDLKIEDLFLSKEIIYSYKNNSTPRTNLHRLYKSRQIKIFSDYLINKRDAPITIRYMEKLEKVYNYKFNQSFFNKKVLFDKGEQKMFKCFSKYKLFVHDMNSTTFLETLYYNIPTLLILDKRSEIIRNRYKKIFEKMEKYKIIHYNPITAAEFINKNYYKIDDWWFNQNLQKVRNFFCYNFVRSSKSSFDDLNKILTQN